MDRLAQGVLAISTGNIQPETDNTTEPAATESLMPTGTLWASGR
jgi:hypothetical protein